MSQMLDSFGTVGRLETSLGEIHLIRLEKLEREGWVQLSRLPFSIRIRKYPSARQSSKGLLFSGTIRHGMRKALRELLF